MDSDGFPERGLGSWEEYRERLQEARQRDNAMIGVLCPHLPGISICAPCVELKRDWKTRNGVGGQGTPQYDVATAALKLAAR